MSSQIQTTASAVRIAAVKIISRCDEKSWEAKLDIKAEKYRIAKLPWWKRFFAMDPEDWHHELWRECERWLVPRNRAMGMLNSLVNSPAEAAVLLDFDDARFLKLMLEED